MVRDHPLLNLLSLGLLLGMIGGGCVARISRDDANPILVKPAVTTASPSTGLPAHPGPTVAPNAPTQAGSAGTALTVGRPPWLGTRVLARRPDGFGEVQPTPPELRDRRLPSLDLLPSPHGDEFAKVQAVPDEVARRSTWSPHCPVTLDDLRYLTLTFWGFDERPHTGELLVHESVAEDVVGVFRRLYEARFPIEEMRVVSSSELSSPPTGDGNNTTAFVCRPATPRGRGGDPRVVDGSSWSEHAYGLAIDLNPFHNPYLKGDLVLPELASAYKQRSWRRPGMIFPGDEATESFARIGWGWGGTWRSAKDWMHFSRSGR